MRLLLLLLVMLAAWPLRAGEPLALRLTLVHFSGGRWQPGEITAAAAGASRILQQCGISPVTTTLVRADVAARFRMFHTPTSRELANTLQPARPAIFFVDGTRQDPPFDAEAVGRGNSRGRPELRDTVWVAHGARDLEITLAHELAHVLMNSGEHSEEPRNLMRAETAPDNTRLSVAQCALLREAGERNGLLRPS